jgi:hypothetical protein
MVSSASPEGDLPGGSSEWRRRPMIYARERRFHKIFKEKNQSQRNTPLYH